MPKVCTHNLSTSPVGFSPCVKRGISVLQWGRLSDRVGRKPILIIGLTGLAVSILLFGLSKTFGGLIVSRSIAGFLNGNGGVLKTAMAEITTGDEYYRAVAFSYLSITWVTGSTLGAHTFRLIAVYSFQLIILINLQHP